jgi:hypothetical protein
VLCHCRYKATQDVEDLVDSLLRIARAAISSSVSQQQQQQQRGTTQEASTATDNDVDAVDEDFEDDDGVSHYTSLDQSATVYYCEQDHLHTRHARHCVGRHRSPLLHYSRTSTDKTLFRCSTPMRTSTTC